MAAASRGLRMLGIFAPRDYVARLSAVSHNGNLIESLAEYVLALDNLASISLFSS